MLHSDQISDPFVTLYYIYIHTHTIQKQETTTAFFGKEFVSQAFKFLVQIFNSVGKIGSSSLKFAPASWSTW